MAKKFNPVFKQKVLKAEKAFQDYRKAHKLLHHKKRHPTEADHAPLVNKMLAKLKKQGFNSLPEFFQVKKACLDEILRDEFEKQAIPREVRLLDLSQNDYAYLSAAARALDVLMQKGVSPDTLLITHSNIERQMGISISRDADVSEELNVAEIRAANVAVFRSQYSGFKSTILSSKQPEPLLISRNIYDEKTAWALWREIMRRIWKLLGIIIDKPSVETNDLTIKGKKITGLWVQPNFVSACCALDLDFDLAERLVRPIAGRTHPKLSIKKRMTSAKIELGRKVSFDEYFGVFKKVIQKMLHITLVPGELTTAEKKLIARYLPKFQSDQWIWEGKYRRK